ncbi:heparan sulfate glucosamine 3-O-sulfotransferase 3B1-like isoform X2 [Convolutriloba macropyga]
MKCGTFALAHFLMHHPQVHVMNEQEYFDKRFLDESFEWYRERQPYTTLDQIVIDKTATYWYASPLRFKTYEEFLQIHHNRSLIYPDLPYPINWKPKSLTDIPELKFIIIVCDPVHRALSHHEMFKYYNWANLDRQQAFSISSEPSIYTVFGKYGHFTAHWLEYFDMSQFLILDGHKFRHDNPAVSLNKVESFLRLKDHFRKEHFEKGKDGRFFCHKSWFGCGPRGKGRFHEPLDPDLAAELTQLYQGDMENFTKLTGMLLPVNSKIR